MYRRHVELQKIADEVQDLINTHPKGAPLIIRPFIHQAVAALQSISVYQKALALTFDRLDQPYGPLPKGMRIVTCREIAENRPRKYAYLA